MIDPEAQKIGAVNTIKISNQGLVGYNTDAHGFMASLKPLLQPHQKKALVLGTGGASKAVLHVLKQLDIQINYVSRKKINSGYRYEELTSKIIQEHLLIVNCTPLGTHPNIEALPAIPYKYLTPEHLLYDLIYNPSETAFLKEGIKRKCSVKNGLEMLEQQAEKAWEIWNL